MPCCSHAGVVFSSWCTAGGGPARVAETYPVPIICRVFLGTVLFTLNHHHFRTGIGTGTHPCHRPTRTRCCCCCYTRHSIDDRPLPSISETNWSARCYICALGGERPKGSTPVAVRWKNPNRVPYVNSCSCVLPNRTVRLIAERTAFSHARMNLSHGNVVPGSAWFSLAGTKGRFFFSHFEMIHAPPLISDSRP